MSRRSDPLCWREPYTSGSLAVVKPAMDTEREVRWRPSRNVWLWGGVLSRVYMWEWG
jgi:hypothetical protein